MLTISNLMIAAIIFITPSAFAQSSITELRTLKDRADQLLLSYRIEAALVTYHEIISKAPDFANCYYNIAICYHEKKEFRKAYEALTRFVTLKPNDSEAYFNMGILKVYMDEESESKYLFRKALSLNPSRELRARIKNALDHLEPSVISQNSLEEIKAYLGRRNQ